MTDSATIEKQITVWHALPRLIVLFVLGLSVIGLIAKWVIE